MTSSPCCGRSSPTPPTSSAPVWKTPTNGRRARRALAARGLPILTAADGIGYAPEGWNGLTTHLQGMGYSDEHLLAAGVSTRTRKNQLIDRFRARITFAVHDVAGDVVGFTARAFEEDRAAAAETGHDLPKYLNTPRRPVRKRELLYGLTPQARALLAAGPCPSWSKAPPTLWPSPWPAPAAG